MKSFLCGVLLVYQKLSVLSLAELIDWGVIFCGFYGFDEWRGSLNGPDGLLLPLFLMSLIYIYCCNETK